MNMIEGIFKAILICLGLLVLLPLAGLLIALIVAAIAAIGPCVHWGVVLDIVLIAIFIALVVSIIKG